MFFIPGPWVKSLGIGGGVPGCVWAVITNLILPTSRPGIGWTLGGWGLLLSSHLGWLSESHNGQWGRGRESNLNFPGLFPSLTSSLVVYLWHLLCFQCQCIWKPIVACLPTLVSLLRGVLLLIGDPPLFFQRAFDLLLKPNWLNPRPKYLPKCQLLRTNHKFHFKLLGATWWSKKKKWSSSPI